MCSSDLFFRLKSLPSRIARSSNFVLVREGNVDKSCTFKHSLDSLFALELLQSQEQEDTTSQSKLSIH